MTLSWPRLLFVTVLPLLLMTAATILFKGVFHYLTSPQIIIMGVLLTEIALLVSARWVRPSLIPRPTWHGTWSNLFRGVLFGISANLILLGLAWLFLTVHWHLWGFAGNASILLNPLQQASFMTKLITDLLITIASPFAEETFFRGALWTGFAQKLSPRSATILSAVIFSLYHGEPSSFFPLFFMGLLLGFLRSKWGLSVSGPAHAAFNATTLLMIWL